MNVLSREGNPNKYIQLRMLHIRGYNWQINTPIYDIILFYTTAKLAVKRP